jgi:DNA polymerase III subunit epsilon
VLQQSVASNKENILLHEISGTAQRGGMQAADALLDFLEYLGKDPLVAFHVAFDQAMICRAIRHYLGFDFKHVWLDLAYVMPGLHPELARRLRTLDDWGAKYSVRNEARHNALSDASATAQLLLVAMSQARHKNISSFEGLMYLEKLHRSLHGHY